MFHPVYTWALFVANTNLLFHLYHINWIQRYWMNQVRYSWQNNIWVEKLNNNLFAYVYSILVIFVLLSFDANGMVYIETLLILLLIYLGWRKDILPPSFVIWTVIKKQWILSPLLYWRGRRDDNIVISEKNLKNIWLWFCMLA